jgi:hypothetical protein
MENNISQAQIPLTEAQITSAFIHRITTRNKETPLENALTKFVALSNLLLGDSQNFDEEKCEELQLHIENEFDLYKLQIEKEILLSKAEEIDINNCNNLTAQYEDEIERIKAEIENLKLDLEKEKLEKENKEKFLALAKMISGHPGRKETEKAIEEVQKELNATEEESAKITSEFNLRSKQFQLVLHGLDLLKQEYDTTI